MMYCTFAAMFIARAYGRVLVGGTATNHDADAHVDVEGHGR